MLVYHDPRRGRRCRAYLSDKPTPPSGRHPDRHLADDSRCVWRPPAGREGVPVHWAGPGPARGVLTGRPWQLFVSNAATALTGHRVLPWDGFPRRPHPDGASPWPDRAVRWRSATTAGTCSRWNTGSGTFRYASRRWLTVPIGSTPIRGGGLTSTSGCPGRQDLRWTRQPFPSVSPARNSPLPSPPAPCPPAHPPDRQHLGTFCCPRPPQAGQGRSRPSSGSYQARQLIPLTDHPPPQRLDPASVEGKLSTRRSGEAARRSPAQPAAQGPRAPARLAP
jgi:hypothetical protein